VIALGYEALIRPNTGVATVNNQTINVAEFQKRVRIEHALLSSQISNELNQMAGLFGGINEAFQFLSQQESFNTRYNEVQFVDTLGLRVLNDMIDDRIVARAAENLGITVTDEEVEAKINEYFNYDPAETALIGVEPTATPTETITPTPFVSPTPSPIPTETPIPTATATETLPPDGTLPTATLNITAAPTEPTPTLSATEVEGNYLTNRDEFFNNIQNLTGVSRSDIYDYFRALTLRDKVAETVATAGTTALFVDARRIQVATQEEALDVLTALQSGENFATLAQSLSLDAATKDLGGELGWQPLFTYPEVVRTQLETTEIAALIGPVEIDGNFHIFQVRGREERDLEEDQIEQRQAEAFSAWLTEQREAEGTTFEIFDTWAENLPTVQTGLQ
jgi:parvulin-like peptidyl-prolyl isomerase